MILLILACAEPRHHGKDSPALDSGDPVVETDSAAETDFPRGDRRRAVRAGGPA